jgi:hypothetical protein
VKIDVAANAKVRVLPANEFDDKGNIKPFKPDPKDPDRKLGGVPGKLEDVEKDMWVAVNLRRNRSGSLHLANVVVVLGKEGASKQPATKSRSSK